ncbi:MAG: molybdopterin oxidoreductase family protein [Saprospiraceae bacterium]
MTHFRTCNLCEAMCGIAIEVEDDKIISIKGDKEDQFSRGHICPKALGLKDIYKDPNRLKRPVRRTEEGWEEISWEEAYDEVADNLLRIQKKYGNDAVSAYAGNPNVHNIGSILFLRPLLKTLRTKNVFSATSTDQLPHHLAAWSMLGNANYMPIPDLNRTDYWLILGGNPLVSNGSIMTVPDVGKRLNEIKKRGGKVVVIDPIKTLTAQRASEHHFIKPNTDVYLLLAFVQQIFANDWVNLRHYKDIVPTAQIAELQELTKDYTPEIAAQYTGISATKIRQLAADFCAAESAVAYGRMGVSVVTYGSLCQWLLFSINILTGNLDRPGGAMFTSPAYDYIGMKKQRPQFGRWKSRVRGLPEFGGELPNVTMAEEMMTGGEGQIKALITSAGNPVLSTANGKQLEKAFAELEYIVCLDIYINETTRFANIILPPATGLEIEHYDMVFHNFAIHNTAKYSEPLFDKGEDARYDWEILQELTHRLQTENDGSKAKIIPLSTIIDHALRSGPYDLSLEKVKANPHGIDLGPLQSQLPSRILTKDAQINLVPDFYKTDLNRLKKEQPDNDEFLLIGRRDLRTNNSWMHNSPLMVKGRNRCTAYLHPEDAKRLQISDNQVITVSSRVGSINIAAEVTPDIMPGVISIPHGWGHGRKGVKLDVATAHAGVSCNDLTDEFVIDELTGNAGVNGVGVNITIPHSLVA